MESTTKRTDPKATIEIGRLAKQELKARGYSEKDIQLLLSSPIKYKDVSVKEKTGRCEMAIAMFRHGYTRTEIAATLNMPYASVCALIRRYKNEKV